MRTVAMVDPRASTRAGGGRTPLLIAERAGRLTPASRAGTMARVRMRDVRTCCLATLLAGCGQPLFLMFEEHLETPEGEHLVGGGCESIGDGTSGTASGSAAGDATMAYSIEHQGHEGEGVRVRVRGGNGQLLQARNYNEDFLLSGEVDEFAIELAADRTLRLRYWGGATCEEPREPD